MNNEKMKTFTLSGIGVGLVGFIMIFFSTDFGSSFADSWLADRGGADTGFYHIMVETYIHNFQIAGGILFGLGLLVLLMASYKMLDSK
ncbi:hypothetical protein [Mesobacillus subterraneus]|uniref:Uncharacterized protein n=1 Tax=Mesobacillus subterraneus TaxID=285983 RepID=A0A3R9FZE5_9BACI|nr:hypothetical protein [Mesobacillus subterraneus]RSD28676.1 hypothetical protein EJA10_03620 [Mesobacillus subterraneus]